MVVLDFGSVVVLVAIHLAGLNFSALLGTSGVEGQWFLRGDTLVEHVV